MEVLEVPYIVEQGRVYVTFQGEDYALEEIAAKTGKKLKTIERRFERYKALEITIDQLFQGEIVGVVTCPKLGLLLCGVNPAEMGKPFFHFHEILSCGRKHYAKGLCHACYDIIHMDNAAYKAKYEQTDAGRERRQRYQEKDDVKALKLFLNRKALIAKTLPPDAKGSDKKLIGQMTATALERLRGVEEDEAKRIATAALSYWKEKLKEQDT